MLFCVCGLYILQMWRWHRFLSTPSSYFISIPFIVAETLVVCCGSCVTYFAVWNQVDRPKLHLADLRIPVNDYPTVDIMVPCYYEPVEVSKGKI